MTVAATADPSRQDRRREGFAAAAELLSAVADPVRLAVLARLVGGPVPVAQLLEEIPIAPNLLSYHLRVLRESGLVASLRRGRRLDYHLTGDALARLHAALPAPDR